MMHSESYLNKIELQEKVHKILENEYKEIKFLNSKLSIRVKGKNIGTNEMEIIEIINRDKIELLGLNICDMKERIRSLIENARDVENVIRYNKVREERIDEEWYLVIIMEYCNGGSLSEWINKQVSNNFPPGRGRISPERGIGIIYNILNGVHELHERGMILRALHSGHVFIKDGVIKVGGVLFYSSLNLEDDYLYNIHLFHNQHIPPLEYIQGTDLWAVGCILYELLMGQNANGRSLNQIINEDIISITSQMEDQPLVILIVRILMTCLAQPAHHEIHQLIIYIQENIPDLQELELREFLSQEVLEENMRNSGEREQITQEVFEEFRAIMENDNNLWRNEKSELIHVIREKDEELLRVKKELGEITMHMGRQLEEINRLNLSLRTIKDELKEKLDFVKYEEYFINSKIIKLEGNREKDICDSLAPPNNYREIEKELTGQNPVYIYEGKINSRYALKLQKFMNEEEEAIKRAEFENMMKCSRISENVIRPISLCSNQSYVDSSYVGILMEHGGLALHKWWNREEASPSRILKGYIELLDGLHLVHKLNIYHGDIKPQNILVDKIFRFVDFGSSKQFSDAQQFLKTRSTLRKTDIRELTPVYCPPEMLMGQNTSVEIKLDKIDVYSLSLTIYSALTKKFRYPNSTEEEYKIYNYNLFLEGIQKELREVLKNEKAFGGILIEVLCKSLSYDPHDRCTPYQIKEILKPFLPQI